MLFNLPDAVREAIDQATAGQDGLARAGAALSLSYRQRAQPRHTTNDARRLAYLATRLPATYAANASVLTTLREAAPDAEITSALDLGAGPGTMLWAVQEIFPAWQCATLLEGDAAFIRLGQQLTQPLGRSVVWQRSDLRAAAVYPPHDLVTISYALNELNAAEQTALTQRAWAAAQSFLLLTEPGSKAGFANILRARDALLAQGAHILAPCPHAGPCPWAESDDWCHFAQRLERTPQHRQAKGGALGYEDEKFSYLIAARATLTPAPARIMRHPVKLKGHVKLTLCTPEGIRQETCARSQAAYKKARKAHWGQIWPPQSY